MIAAATMVGVDNLVRYFTAGTQGSRTLATIGAEVETHFVDDDGAPISADVSRALLSLDTSGQPWSLSPELGRQLLELQVDPCASSSALLARTGTALHWLYEAAAARGARPFFGPVLQWEGPLLREPTDSSADSRRDAVFIDLDGRAALEQLTRIASVQFTFSVDPAEAITLLNRVLAARLAERGYPNDRYWRRYIALAEARYGADRYGGPSGFADLADYVRYLASHPVIMRGGEACDPPSSVAALGDSAEEISLFLRSVWNYCRLRRYGDTLALEVRPFARGSDDKIERDLSHLLAVVAG